MHATAFAPVPIMLILFNLISKRKGSKWGFQLALLVFALVMFAYPLGGPSDKKWAEMGDQGFLAR